MSVFSGVFRNRAQKIYVDEIWDRGSGIVNIGDVLKVDITNSKVIAPIGTATHPGLTITDKDGSLDNGFYANASAANQIELALGGSTAWIFTSSAYFGAGGAGIASAAATATTPVLVPSVSDADTGVGKAGPDALSHIAGGVEGMRITNTGSGINVDIKGDLNAVVSAGAVVTSGGQMVFN